MICDNCNGSGREGHGESCNVCGGKGQVMGNYQRIKAWWERRTEKPMKETLYRRGPCNECAGAKTIEGEECWVCHGSGYDFFAVEHSLAISPNLTIEDVVKTIVMSYTLYTEEKFTKEVRGYLNAVLEDNVQEKSSLKFNLGVTTPEFVRQIVHWANTCEGTVQLCDKVENYLKTVLVVNPAVDSLSSKETQAEAEQLKLLNEGNELLKSMTRQNKWRGKFSEAMKRTRREKFALEIYSSSLLFEESFRDDGQSAEKAVARADALLKALEIEGVDDV
jgi:hypothetical protein